MHWQRHKSGAAHWREMAARGEKMPVVIAIGGDPASIYSGSAPLPPGIDEFLFAGFIRREQVELAQAVTCDLDVPAEAEIVIEGYIDPAEPLVMEGPFGDHTGFYSLADLYPRMHVTAVTMKQQPIYAATLVGRPPMEDYWLGHATERIFLPLLKLTVPEIVDYHMPAAGIFHNLVFVSIDKQYPGQAYKVMHALWGQGLMSLAKVLVVVDKDVNVHDADEVWWVALNHIDPKRDVEFVRGPVDVLDHAVAAFHLRQQDGDRRHAEVARGRIHPRVAGADRDGRGDEAAGRRDVDAGWGSSDREREPASEGQTFSGTDRASRAMRRLVKLPHTVFALPFALLGVLAASRVAPLTLRTVVLVVVAFSAARFAAMGFNRIADRVYDATQSAHAAIARSRAA